MNGVHLLESIMLYLPCQTKIRESQVQIHILPWSLPGDLGLLTLHEPNLPPRVVERVKMEEGRKMHGDLNCLKERQDKNVPNK